MSKQPDPSRKVLGRGLSSLLPSRPPQHEAAGAAPAKERPTGSLSVPIDRIEPNPMQPRTVFDTGRLEELAQSIRTNGVIQPLVVQQQGDRYQLIAGERRWRAAQAAGLAEVPVVVRDLASNQLLELALIENVQREDLNAIEVAHALDRLARELKLSHDEIGHRTGKDRSTITNLLRLLKLPTEVQALVADNQLSMGHARALLALPTADLQRQIAERAVTDGLSVRALEKLVQLLTRPAEEIPEPKAPVPQDPNVRAAMEELERTLGTKVRIVERNAQRGRIEIEYYSQDDLQRIYAGILGDGRG